MDGYVLVYTSPFDGEMLIDSIYTDYTVAEARLRQLRNMEDALPRNERGQYRMKEIPIDTTR